jgi:hypothetical protein
MDRTLAMSKEDWEELLAEFGAVNCENDDWTEDGEHLVDPDLDRIYHKLLSVVEN